MCCAGQASWLVPGRRHHWHAPTPRTHHFVHASRAQAGADGVCHRLCSLNVHETDIALLLILPAAHKACAAKGKLDVLPLVAAAAVGLPIRAGVGAYACFGCRQLIAGQRAAPIARQVERHGAHLYVSPFRAAPGAAMSAGPEAACRWLAACADCKSRAITELKQASAALWSRSRPI